MSGGCRGGVSIVWVFRYVECSYMVCGIGGSGLLVLVGFHRLSMTAVASG